MIVLALDCSSSLGSVAVVDDGDCLFSQEFPNPRGRADELFEVLADAIGKFPIITRIVVGTGPGAYNGLRSSVAAAEGIALATGADRVGICSLLSLPGGDDFIACGDARGGSIYAVRIRAGILGGLNIIPRSEIAAWVDDLGADLPILVPNLIVELPAARVAHPDARNLALLGADEAPVEQIQPIYAKPVHITLPKKKPIQPMPPVDSPIESNYRT